MFSVIKSGFCSKLTSEFDLRMNQLTGVERQLDSQLRSLKIGLASITGWSPHWAINKFKRDIGANLNNIVPSLSQFDELATLANLCVFTQQNSMLSKPSTLAKSIKTAVKSNADQALTSLASGIPSEFSAAKLVGALKSQIKTSNVNLIVPEAKQALNCMSGICGTNITSRLATLQGFLSKFNISELGELDVSALLASQGIGQLQIDAINRVSEQIDGVMDRIDNAFESGIDYIKRVIPEDDDDE